MRHLSQTQSSREKVSKEFPLLELMIAVATIGILVTIVLQKFLAH